MCLKFRGSTSLENSLPPSCSWQTSPKAPPPLTTCYPALRYLTLSSGFSLSLCSLFLFSPSLRLSLKNISNRPPKSQKPPAARRHHLPLCMQLAISPKAPHLQLPASAPLTASIFPCTRHLLIGSPNHYYDSLMASQVLTRG